MRLNVPTFSTSPTTTKVTTQKVNPNVVRVSQPDENQTLTGSPTLSFSDFDVELICISNLTTLQAVILTRIQDLLLIQPRVPVIMIKQLNLMRQSPLRTQVPQNTELNLVDRVSTH